MKRLRAGALIWMAALASQAGHLVAYELRFGAAAQNLQSSGPHGYFPGLAKTALGVAAAVLIIGLLIVGVARLVAGRELESSSAPPYVRLLAGLFTIQLAIYCAQETLEAQLSGMAFGSATDLVLWGALGQLPAAAAAALALRWLMARLRPAVRALSLRLSAPIVTTGLVLVAIPVGLPARQDLFLAGFLALPLSRRGPPSLAR